MRIPPDLERMLLKYTLLQASLRRCFDLIRAESTSEIDRKKLEAIRTRIEADMREIEEPALLCYIEAQAPTPYIEGGAVFT